MIRWRIYYDDFSTFDYTMGEPWERPGRGVICIVQDDPNHPNYSVNTQVLSEFPYYFFRKDWGYWCGASQAGIFDQLLTDRGHNVVICEGRWADYLVYREILDKAKSDPDFYLKSGVSTAEKLFDQ